MTEQAKGPAKHKYVVIKKEIGVLEAPAKDGAKAVRKKIAVGETLMLTEEQAAKYTNRVELAK